MYWYFLNPISAIIVLLPILLAVALLSQRSWRQRLAIIRDLGIPIGIACSLIGMAQVFGIDDGDVVGPATAVMLITIFYGGTLSAAGYFLAETKWAASDHHGCVPISFWRPAIVVTSFILTLLFAIFSGGAG